MFKDKLDIPDSHELVQTNRRVKDRSEYETEFTDYNELDSNGNIISKYTIEETIIKYPPFKISQSYTKYDADGSELEEGNL